MIRFVNSAARSTFFLSLATSVPDRRLRARAMAAGLLHLMLWGTVVFGMQAVLGGVMRASGTVWAPVSIAIACILLVQLPTAHVLDRRYGLAGVWLSYPVVFCAMLLCQGAFYWWVWRHRRIERLV